MRDVPVAKIHGSPTNPRKSFDEAKLEELAGSIREKGVLEPLLLRPAKGGYECVAGERRLRAARLAGRVVVPAVIRALTDDEVLEIQLVENLQRQDLNPLEEAAGIEQWLARHQGEGAVKELARKLGKSTGHIYGMRKLGQLPTLAAKAVTEGTIPIATAQLIARVPGEKARAEAAKEIIRPMHGDGEPRSYRNAQHLIHQRFMIELKQAPYSTDDAGLVASVGACTVCPKRTGNNKAEYPDARPDVCTDPACYEVKVKAHQDRLVAAAKASGKKVLTGKAAKEVFSPYGELAYKAPYLALNATCYDDRKGRTYRQLLGKELAGDVVLGRDSKGQLHELVPKAKAAKVLKEKGVGSRSSSRSGADNSWQREQAKRRAKEQVDKAVLRRAQGLVAVAAEKLAAGVVGFTPAITAMLQAIALSAVRHSWDDSNRQIILRRGLEKPKTGHAGQNRDPVADLIPTLDSPQVLGLLCELAACRQGLVTGYATPAGEHKAFWSVFGLDPAKVGKEVRAELAAKERAKPSANGHARNGKHKNGRAARQAVPEGAGQEEEDEEPAAQERKPQEHWLSGLKTGDRVKLRTGLGVEGTVIALRAGDKPSAFVEWGKMRGRKKPVRAYHLVADLVEVDRAADVESEIELSEDDGRCRVCGCTEDEPCAGGCAWIEPGLCDNPDCLAASPPRSPEGKRRHKAMRAAGDKVLAGAGQGHL
jgi:ParB/RepB/Spo0J family partition protein